MKVKNAINILELTIDILRQYENNNLEDILKDIKEKIPYGENNPKSSVVRKSEDKPDKSYSGIIDKIKEMTKEEQIAYLSKFKKAELIKIAASIEIKLQSRDKKDTLIHYIINHFSFIELNEQIGKRPNQLEKMLKL